MNGVGSTQEPPEWAMPTIRALVKAFSYPAATPHIYTGVESILPLLARMATAAVPETPSKRPRRSAAAAQPRPSEVSDTRTLALIAVVVFYVLSRMMDQDITPEQFIDWRNKAVTILLKTLAGKQTTEENILAEIEELMPMAQEEGWLQMEWFLNIAPPDDVYEMEGVETTNGVNRTINGRKRTLKDSFGSDYIGLGTMMQDVTDYLGELQQEDYKRWKAGIIARIEEIEAS
jgi:origin recognition complex subunit 6